MTDKIKQCGNCEFFLSSLKECNYPMDQLPACATKWRVDVKMMVKTAPFTRSEMMINKILCWMWGHVLTHDGFIYPVKYAKTWGSSYTVSHPVLIRKQIFKCKHCGARKNG